MDSLFRRLVLHVSILSTVLFLSVSLFKTNVQATPLLQLTQSPELFYDELQIIYLVNLTRRENGLAPLRWNRELSLSARWFAQNSVEQRTGVYCSHTDTQNRSPGDRMVAFQYSNAATWGENVVCGFAGADAAIQGWMNSPGHKQNILSETYREIGVGYYRNSQSGRGYIAQDFSYDPSYAPIIINNEALSTTTAEVQLYIYKPVVQSGLKGIGDAVDMMIANDPTFANANWEPFAQEKSWLLEAGEGWREVYVKTRDIQGRTTIVSDAIYLGTSLPQDTLYLDQASKVETQLAFYNLDKIGWPAVQLSMNWQGDNSDIGFEHISGDGQEISDEQATGGTVLRLSGTTPGHARYWTTEFYKNVPLIAYFRLKVIDNEIGTEVLSVKINSGGTEYGPLIIKGRDFVQANTYQEFSLPFTFHENSDDPYLIFNLYSSGKSTIDIDRITIYTSAMPTQTRLDWQVLEGYHRSRSVWGRFVNSEGAFTEATELIPNIETVSPLLPPIAGTSSSAILAPQSLPTDTVLPHSGDSGNWRTYTTEDALLSNNIQALAYREDALTFPPCDSPQRTNCPVIPGLWVGTDNGLTYVNGRESTKFLDRLPDADVRDLLFIGGKLWIATTAGLTWLDDNHTPQNFTDDQWGLNYLSGQEVSALTHAQGIIWASTTAGLVKIDPANGQTYTYLPTSQVTTVTRCAAVLGDNCDVTLNNALWFGADGTVYRLDLSTDHPVPEPLTDVPLTATTTLSITGLTRSAEGIWISGNAGVAFWNGTTWNSAPLYDGMKHLPLLDIRAIDVDNQGRIWIATNAGALYWHVERHTWHRYFRPRDPIASNNVQTMLIDPHGVAWLGTDAGLSAIDDAWKVLDEVTTYDYRANLVSKDVGAVVFDQQGRTWLSTLGGITVIGRSPPVFSSFTTENGLASNDVRSVAFDDQGRTWLGTAGGLTVVKKDLDLLSTFTTEDDLTSNDVRSIVLDKLGRTWLGTAGGVTVISKELEVLRRITTNEGLASNDVQNMVLDDQGRTWLDTTEGVTVISKELEVRSSFTTEHGLASNNVDAIMFDGQGRTWLTTADRVTVIGRELNVRSSFTTENRLASNNVQPIAFDNQGRTWLHTSGGMTVLGSELEMLRRFTTENGLVANGLQAVAFDDEGRTWLGTTGGVTVVGRELDILQSLTAEDGLVANDVQAVTFDNQGRIWLRPDYGGVTVVSQEMKVLQRFTKENGLPSNDVDAVMFDEQGRIWLDTADGVTVVGQELKVLKNLTIENGLPSNDVQMIAFDEQGLTWLDTVNGVTMVGQGLEVLSNFIAMNIGPNDVHAVAFDKEGRIWLRPDHDGVIVVGRELEVLKKFTTANGLTSNDVQAVAFDQQNRGWIRPYYGGVTVVGQGLQVLISFTTKNGLPSNYVDAVVFDKQGRTWLDSAGGVTVIGQGLEVLTNFTTANGLLSNDVNTIGFDKRKRAWLGTVGGVAVIGQGLEVLTTFTAANGLLSNDVGTVEFDEQGRTWLGTAEGVTVIGRELEVLTSFTTANGLLSNDVRAVEFDEQGRTWVLTWNSGSQQGGVTVVSQEMEVLQNFTTENGLASNNVNTIVFDEQGRTWLDTVGGTTVIGQELAVLTNFTTTNGLASNQRWPVTFDSQGYAWLRTDNGLTVVGQELEILNNFTTANGLLSNTLYTVAFDEQGRTWLPTTDGVIIFSPQLAAHLWLQTAQIYDCGVTCHLVDTRQLALTLTGGSLLAPPEVLGYRITLSNLLSHQTIFSQTFPFGTSGQQGLLSLTFGQEKPLAYAPHQLTVEVFDRNLAAYRLPPLRFDVQASPHLTLSQVGGIDRTLLTQAEPSAPVSPLAGDFSSPLLTPAPQSILFPTSAPLPIAWQADDADAEVDQLPHLEYTWAYQGTANESQWQTPITVTNSITLAFATIAPPPMNRGDPDRPFDLALRVVDADGNPSAVVIQTLTFRAPFSIPRLLAPYAGALASMSLLLLVGLVMLARNSGLPFQLLLRQGAGQWVPVGLGYRRYHAQWTTLTPLEQLLLLLVLPKLPIDQPALQASLDAYQTPVPIARLEEALASLTRQQLLLRRGDGYHATEPALLAALQSHEGQTGRQRLGEIVRTEHPLFATARHFFTAASFDLQPVADPLAFLCLPTASLWQRQLSGPIYARLFPGEELGQAAVTALGAAAQQTQSTPNAATPTLTFAIVDHTPSDSGWMAIGALRAEGIQVVPIDDGLMQQARIEQQEQRALQLHIRRFIGRERDLFNVRDPVADRLNFFGREQRTHDLLEALSDGRPQALLGLRKMGKSSLLQVMRERAPFAVAHVDLQAGQEPLGLYTRILQEWQQALHIRQPALAWTPPPLAGDPTTAFTAATRALLQALDQAGLEPHLGLFIDEFDLLMPRQGQLHDTTLLARYLTITQALRGLVQETGRFALLVAGVDARFNRVNRWGEEQNPFYQFFQETYLEPLSSADCQQMVRNIGRQMGLVFDDAAAAAVARLSGGHPFLARQLCSTALTLRQGDEPLLSLDLLERAATLFVRQPSTAANLDEQGLWGEVTNPALWPPAQIIENQALLQTLAHVPEAPEPALLAAGTDPTVRTQSLYELTQRSVVQRLTALPLPERLRLHLELFGAWIRAYRRSEPS